MEQNLSNLIRPMSVVAGMKLFNILQADVNIKNRQLKTRWNKFNKRVWVE